MNNSQIVKESYRQRHILKTLKSEGYTLGEDPCGLAEYIGSVVTVPVTLKGFSDTLLCRINIEGTEGIENSYHLIALWQIVKYAGVDIIKAQNDITVVFPESISKCPIEFYPGMAFMLTCVVGVRTNDDRTYTPALRLPQK